MRCELSVILNMDCAVQKLPPAMTPRAAIAESAIRNIKQAPHICAHPPGEHSMPFSSGAYVVGTERDALFVDDDMSLVLCVCVFVKGLKKIWPIEALNSAAT
jgi:hypothetical protein